MLILGTVVGEDQKTGAGQALHKALQQGLRLGICPVKILEHDQERLRLALSEQEVPDAVDRPLPTFPGLQPHPLLVIGLNVEQSQNRRQGEV